EVAVQTRAIRMVKHVHHVSTSDSRGIVQAGVIEASGLEVDDTVVGVLDHVFLGAEYDGAGRTGLDACGFLADRDAVGAQGALVSLVVLVGKTRNVEGTAGDAVAAADAVLFVEIDDPVVVLDDGAG